MFTRSPAFTLCPQISVSRAEIRVSRKAAGKRVVIDGRAEDDTPEAIFIEGAPGFSLAVQWHPEYNAASDPVSRPLFEAFGDAVRAWASRACPQRRSA